MARQDYQRTWYRTQGGLTVTKRSLKIGGGESDYPSRAIGSWRLIIGSQ